MWILKKLLDKLNSFTAKYNRLLRKFEEKQKEEYKNRLDILKIIDNKDYIIKNASTKRWEFLVYSIISFFIGYVISLCKAIFTQFHLELFFIFILLLLLLIAYNSFMLFIFSLFKILRYVMLSLSMSVNAFIIGCLVIDVSPYTSVPERIVKFIKCSFVEFNLNNIFDGKVYQFWLIISVLSLASCISLYLFLKSQSILKLEDMETENRLVLWILAIVTFIIGVDIDKVRPIGITLLVLVFQTAFFEFYYPHLISKNHKKAQNIFQEQLLLEKPRYEALKECYYHGGEKYKEKLLSTEKFLEVVVKNELKSLKYLKTYDDYRLYKAYKGRS